MTTNTPEPTLRDIADKLDRLEGDVTTLKGDVTTLKGDVTALKGDVTTLKGDVTTLKEEVMRFNDRFTNYQQATQWVVQLAFALIASATVTVVISSVFSR